MCCSSNCWCFRKVEHWHKLNRRNQNTTGKRNERKYQNLVPQPGPPYHRDSLVSSNVTWNGIPIEDLSESGLDHRIGGFLKWYSFILTSRYSVEKFIWKCGLKTGGMRPLDVHMNGEIRLEDCGQDLFGSGYGPLAGCCEDGNESSGSIKGDRATTIFWRTVLCGLGVLVYAINYMWYLNKTNIFKFSQNITSSCVVEVGWYVIMKHFIRYLAFSCARSSPPIATTSTSTEGGSPAETCDSSCRSREPPAALVCSSAASATELAHFQTHGEKSVFITASLTI